MISLAHLAKALGGNVTRGRNGPFVLAPGPGHSPKDRSMSVALSANDPDGFVVYSHADDDWRTCREHVRERLGINRAPPPERGAIETWERAKDPESIVRLYLSRRGLILPDDVAGRVVRFHPRCPWGSERRPAMLTAFRSIADDQLVAIHRTLLSDDGRKIDRRMWGPVRDAAIKIDRDEDVETGLHIAEGFETGLAGRQLGFQPVWALGSAVAISAFPVLAGIDALTILAETDDSGANARAVRACGHRWFDAGREVIEALPLIAGDMNDVVMP